MQASTITTEHGDDTRLCAPLAHSDLRVGGACGDDKENGGFPGAAAPVAGTTTTEAKTAAVPEPESEGEPEYYGEIYTVVAPDLDVEGSKLGTLYTSVAHCLLRRSWWQRGQSTRGRFHLLLGHAGAAKVPFKRLALCESMFRITPLVNFYRGFKALCRKAQMVTTLRHYCAARSLRLDHVVPESFVFYPAKPEMSETDAFRSAYARHAAAAAGAANGTDAANESSNAGARNVWIVKPSDGSKGNNILVMEHEHEILNHIEAQAEGSIAWVVQRYIERPLLLPGRRKFDIRCWVLLTPGYGVYMYREGVLRTTSVPYSLDDLSDRFAHLSNHCIQEQHPDFGTRADAGGATNEMWFHEFDAFLRKHSGGSVTLASHVLPQLHRIVVLTLLSVREQLEGSRGYDSFNLFGFDFMLDDAYKASLLEINSSPAVAEKLREELAESLVRAAIDRSFPPPQDAPGATAELAAAAEAGDGGFVELLAPGADADACARAEAPVQE